MASGNIVRSRENLFRDHLPPTFTAMAERTIPVRRPVPNLFVCAILTLSHSGKCEKGIVASFLAFDNTRRFGEGASGAAETRWRESVKCDGGVTGQSGSCHGYRADERAGTGTGWRRRSSVGRSLKKRRRPSGTKWRQCRRRVVLTAQGGIERQPKRTPKRRVRLHTS